MNLWTILERAERLYPNALAAVDGERRFDYATVATRTRALAARLRSLGVERGDRVAILAPNSLEFLESYFAAAGLGAILCPLNTRLSPRELAEILDDAKPRIWIAHRSFEELVRSTAPESSFPDSPNASAFSRAFGESGKDCAGSVLWIGDERTLAFDGANFEPANVDPDAVAQLYYTSGTTGRAKGVMLTHRNVATHALGAIAELSLSDRDVWGHIAPMFHLADAWAVFALTWVGARHVFVPRFDEQLVLAAIERERLTITNLIPIMLQRLVRTEGVERRDFSSFRLILSGGASIAPEVVRRVMAVFRCEYVQTYGMTETSPYLTLSLLKEHLKSLPEPEQFRYRAKTGRAFIAIELEVIGDDGRPVARDGRAVGEIRVRGETVTPGYWNRPEETARAFADGWLCTGDLATLDSEGYVEIVDRRTDMINTGGEKVYSTEVEHVLYAHPAVLEAAVFGVPDPEWGESVRAALVLRERASASSDELEAFCRERLAGFKVPRRFEFLAELPKTGTGKISKLALRGTDRERNSPAR